MNTLNVAEMRYKLNDINVRRLRIRTNVNRISVDHCNVHIRSTPVGLRDRCH